MAARSASLVRCHGAWLVVVASLAAGCGDDQKHGTVQPVTQTGALVVAGDLDVLGLTTDDVAAVLDQQQGGLAVDVATGHAEPVDPAADFVSVDGPAVVAFHNFDLVTAIGDVTAWTRATGAVSLAHDATRLHAVNTATGRILLSEGSSSDGTTTQLVVKALDGTVSLPVATVSRLAPCGPRVASTPMALVVSYCAPGSQTVVAAAVDPMTGAITTLAADAGAEVSVVPGGGELVAIVSAGHEGSLVTTAGQVVASYGTAIDALFPAPDGSAVFVQTNGGLQRARPDGSAPVALVASGVAWVRAISGTGQQVLFNGTLGNRNNYGSLLLTSGVTPGPTDTLVSTLDGTTFGSAFTADESHVLYISEADDNGVGTLQSRGVGGGAARVHGHDVWTETAYAGSRVVFTADYFEVPKRLVGDATIETVDTNAGAAPAVIATDAGGYFFVTAANDRVVYSFHADAGSGPGLYVAPLP